MSDSMLHSNDAVVTHIASTETEPLEVFCETLLDLIKARSPFTAELTSILSGLSQAVGGGCDESLDRLYHELNILDNAAEQLKMVCKSPFVQQEGEFETVLKRLESGKQRILKIAQALEMLRLNAVGHDLDLGKRTNYSEATLDRARAYFEEAEGRRERGELQTAEALYTKSLRINEKFIPALLNRGRVRLLSKQPVLAIEDLTRAIQLDDREPIAYCWRGDAYTFCERLDTAIKDYSRALEIRPDFFLASYNRAVAYRLSGNLAAALAEFHRLVHLRPNHSGIFLNRGLVFQLQGDMTRAVADFEQAIRLQPNSSEAMQCLKAAKVLIEDVHPTESDHRVPSLADRSENLEICSGAFADSSIDSAQSTSVNCCAKEAASGIREMISSPSRLPIVPNSPIAIASTESPSSNSQDASRELQDAEIQQPRDSRGSMTVHCPSCFQETSIRWNKLQAGRVVACPNCRRHFTLTAKGELSEIVKDTNGKWAFLAKVVERRRLNRMRRLQIGMTVAFLLVCTTTFFWGSRMGQGLGNVEATLPMELEPRAELFARAWLMGDSRTMRRLTDPAQDRLLFTWYRRNSPPLIGNSESAPKDVRVEMTKLPSQPPITWMRVRFDGLAINSEQPPAELQLAWEERSGNWIFQPGTQ